jgi:hypothetical protein
MVLITGSNGGSPAALTFQTIYPADSAQALHLLLTSSSTKGKFTWCCKEVVCRMKTEHSRSSTLTTFYKPKIAKAFIDPPITHS